MSARVCQCGSPIARSNAPRCRRCANAHRVYWTRERITYALTMFWLSNDRPPTAKELSGARPDMPSYITVRNTFGTFNKAIAAIGLTPRQTGGQRGRPHKHKRVVMVPTVENGFTAEEELAYLIVQQKRDEQLGARVYGACDPLRSAFIARNGGGLWSSDGWTKAVHHLVDRRREIDQWADAA